MVKRSGSGSVWILTSKTLVGVIPNGAGLQAE
jgi:hypothetical protein